MVSINIALSELYNDILKVAVKHKGQDGLHVLLHDTAFPTRGRLQTLTVDELQIALSEIISQTSDAEKLWGDLVKRDAYALIGLPEPVELSVLKAMADILVDDLKARRIEMVWGNFNSQWKPSWNQKIAEVAGSLG